MRANLQFCSRGFVPWDSGPRRLAARLEDNAPSRRGLVLPYAQGSITTFMESACIDFLTAVSTA